MPAFWCLLADHSQESAIDLRETDILIRQRPTRRLTSLPTHLLRGLGRLPTHITAVRRPQTLRVPRPSS